MSDVRIKVAPVVEVRNRADAPSLGAPHRGDSGWRDRDGTVSACREPHLRVGDSRPVGPGSVRIGVSGGRSGVSGT
ncbi:hypothetical protein GCM10010245_58230 [Streptomyces spectabilis]|nr:hypothetical protein GCM10010245_58230 [Streptomyces spectabilis]